MRRKKLRAGGLRWGVGVLVRSPGMGRLCLFFFFFFSVGGFLPIRQRVVERIPPLALRFADPHSDDDDVVVAGRVERVALENHAGAQGASEGARAHAVEVCCHGCWG